MIAFVSPKTTFFFLLPLFGLLLASCNTTQYLQEEEVFLVKNEIELSKELKIKKKGNLKYQLSTLYKQKANENFLFVPKEWFFYRLQDTLDKSQFIKRYRRWQMRQFGEAPTLHDQELTDATAQAMEYYLQHLGYFQADVEADFNLTNESGTKGRVTYYVSPREQYLIDTVAYFSKDSAIHQKLQLISRKSILKAGEPMSEELYNLEVRRITDYFRNDGYAYFQSNHVAGLQGDSLDGKISLQVEVLRPHNDSIHRQYYIGDIFIQPKYDPNDPVATRIDTIQEGIYILSKGGDYGIKIKTLLSDLYLENGALFRQSNYDKTKRQLGALGVFRIITLREEPDPDDPTKINYRLFLTPNKRYEYGLDLEINTSNSPLIDQRLLGVAGSISNRHRNLFKGAELLIANVEGGVDLNLRNLDSIVNTLDFRIQTDSVLSEVCRLLLHLEDPQQAGDHQ
jgi:outer membrane protein insertion porin family